MEEALTLTKFLDVVRARFKAAYTAGLAKMQQYIDNPAPAVKFYRRLKVFDPRNIRDMEAPWSSVSDLLSMEPNPDDDDDMKQRKEKVNALLASEWHRYTQLERHRVHSHHHIDTFWRARGALNGDVEERFTKE